MSEVDEKLLAEWRALRERAHTLLDTAPTSTTIERVVREAIDRLELSATDKTSGLPTHKTCSTCASSSTNDPCDACYLAGRKPPPPRSDKDGEDLHPCMSCGKSLTRFMYCDACENYLV